MKKTILASCAALFMVAGANAQTTTREAEATKAKSNVGVADQKLIKREATPAMKMEAAPVNQTKTETAPAKPKAESATSKRMEVSKEEPKVMPTNAVKKSAATEPARAVKSDK
jgi:hypothetical protein